MGKEKLMNILKEEMRFTDIEPLNIDIAGVAGASTRNCFLYKGTAPGGNILAIKAGDIGSTAGDEVLKNYEAYEFSKSLGVDVIPSPYSFVQQNGMNILVMEYGRRNFITEIRNGGWVEKLCERDAGFLFLNTADRLKEVYKKTLRVDAEASKNFVRAKIADQARYFESYLVPAGLVGEDATDRVKALDIEKLAPEKVTWTTGGELTPEQICSGKCGCGIFIVDPRRKEELMGLPQVDLGMFAVLSRDIYKLPRGDVGYRMMRKVSNEMSKLQGANDEALWAFAEMRQYSLSSRFRIGKEDERAVKYANIAQEKLETLEGLL